MSEILAWSIAGTVFVVAVLVAVLWGRRSEEPMKPTNTTEQARSTDRTFDVM
ncbi:MAG: hypothetical protein WC184_01115 [Acidimicrobiia bacterium]